MEAAQARLSPHFAKRHIVGNHMSRLIYALMFAYNKGVSRRGPYTVL